MVNTIRSLGLRGIAGYEVQVECALSGGLPAFDVVGLPDAAVKESRERVRSAIKACGAKFPVSRITINLAPAALKKEGTLYDLPILLGILAAQGDIDPPSESAAFLGELSLTGALRPIVGTLPMALAAAPTPSMIHRFFHFIVSTPPDRSIIPVFATLISFFEKFYVKNEKNIRFHWERQVSAFLYGDLDFQKRVCYNDEKCEI